MKFKKLEIYGFKSFADKLEVKYCSGITAIVGPNGCGKSNVADSIRWVLGEQSAKLLRGSSMQDVIFGGTEKRKALSFCEVNLYFDNSEKLFPNIAFEEVVISRKLYRSGESEYCINKTPCRLKDITELLRDGGMGREGYSIIGQGRIDELLSAKPEDRRVIFEEAAGISKFKTRKVESERKLGRTRDNILRIEDIMAEKVRILEPLRKQSESAKKWLTMRDRLKYLEINKYLYQFDTASIAKEAIGLRLKAVIDELTFRQSESESYTKKYNDLMIKIASLDRTLSELRDQYLQLNVKMERQSGEIKVFKERIGFFVLQNERLTTDNTRLNKDYLMAIDFTEQKKSILDAEKLRVSELKKEYAQLNEQYLKIVDSLTEGEDAVQVNYLAVLDATDKLADIKSNMSRLIAERDGLIGVVENLEKKIAACSVKIKDESLRQTALSGELKIADTYLLKQKESLIRLQCELGSVNTDLDACLSENDRLSNEFHNVSGRRKLLKEIQESFEGFAYSVKKLINDSKTNIEVSSKIEGLVAQIINVGRGFETAIEMALGNAVQNIVTKNEDDAKYLVEYLKRMRYGRATFLPMTSVKPREISGSLRQSLSIKGCYGVASELVEYDNKYDTVVKSLLGSTVIVEDMDVAVLLARRTGYAFRIVTKDGDIIAPQGSITGGSKKSDSSNIFAHDRELKDLEDMTNALNKKLGTIGAKKISLLNVKTEKEHAIEILASEISAISVDIAAKKETLNRLNEEIYQHKQELVILEQESTKYNGRIAEIESDIDSVEELEQIISSKKISVSASSKEKQQKFEQLRLERNILSERVTELRIQISSTENLIVATETEIHRLSESSINYTGKIEENNVQIQENNIEIGELNREINQVIENSTDVNAENIKEIKIKINGLDDYRQKLQDEVASMDIRRQEIMEQTQKLFERKSQEEFQLQKVDIDIEQMQRRISEEYQLEYDDCLPFKEAKFDIESGSIEISKLLRQMHALGNINIDSIEQCEEYSKEYNEMEAQRADLLKAEADLLKIIKELSDEMLERFTEEFSKIRTNFVKIFKELFDGGTADLVLLENENPLEAGIEIVAQPPQKKLQSISLLSGGERALTAIAILFAILKLKPMPFCVLDEIEAALDDANARRFAKYLRRFSEETQFIVITHRKPTMELADNLYGVTMEEKGVSKIVSVKLSEAIVQGEAIGA